MTPDNTPRGHVRLRLEYEAQSGNNYVGSSMISREAWNDAILRESVVIHACRKMMASLDNALEEAGDE